MIDSYRDIPIVGSLAAVGFDILLFSGDTILALGFVLIETIELWVPLLSYLSRLSERLSWLPTDQIESVLIIAIAILVLVYAARIVRRLTDTLRDT